MRLPLILALTMTVLIAASLAPPTRYLEVLRATSVFASETVDETESTTPLIDRLVDLMDNGWTPAQQAATREMRQFHLIEGEMGDAILSWISNVRLGIMFFYSTEPDIGRVQKICDLLHKFNAAKNVRVETYYRPIVDGEPGARQDLGKLSCNDYLSSPET